MITSHAALAFVLAAALLASFAGASPLRFRRLGELQDDADVLIDPVDVDKFKGDQEIQNDPDVMGGAAHPYPYPAHVQGDKKLEELLNKLLIEGEGEGIDEDKHNSMPDDDDYNPCESGDRDQTCETDYEKIDAGLTLVDAKDACALIGEGWDVCTLEQLCPSNNGTATGPTLPAAGIIEKYGTFPFSSDAYVPFLSADDGDCTTGGSVQLGTGDSDAGTDTCEVYTESSSERRRLEGCTGDDSTNGGVICCGCEMTREKPPEAPDHTYDCESDLS